MANEAEARVAGDCGPVEERLHERYLEEGVGDDAEPEEGEDRPDFLHLPLLHAPIGGRSVDSLTCALQY